MWFLLPFEPTGPLISMLVYVIADSIIFILFALLAVMHFGLAIHVLVRNTFIRDDEDGFDSPGQSCLTMFYAVLGQFDPDVNCNDSLVLLTKRVFI